MKKVDFADGHIVRNILQTTFPLLIAQIVSLLYSIVDRIYIGRIPGTGTAALGAVGLCFPVIILITGFTNLYGLGGAPLFSMALGQGDREKAGKLQNTVLRLEIVTALAILVLGELAAPRLLALFGADEGALAFSVPYLRWYLLGTVFAMAGTGMNPFITAQGFSAVGMGTVLVGAGANIVLDPVFIFALRLGVRGAAIATVLSQLLALLFALRFLLGPRNEFPLRPPAAGERVFPYAGDIIGLGIASFVMQGTNAAVSAACNGVLMRTGGAAYVSVMTIVSSARQILDTPVHAIAEGSSPVISFNYGAGKPERVRRAITVMACMAIGYTLLMWAFIEWQPGAVLGIFSSDAALRELSLRPLHLYFFAFIFQALQYSGQTVFKAVNKKGHAIFFSLFRKAVIVVPLTFLLPTVFGMGTDGVFLAEPISNVVGGTACFVTMLVTMKREWAREREHGT